ncbi:MAG: hypothetical protein Ct9H90mP11_05200 [Acidimicrobiales bacterium]|nr:MAG: hypothetical protein Ct9H90mP11_05200 [Acidimicrobiales bacterium]
MTELGSAPSAPLSIQPHMNLPISLTVLSSGAKSSPAANTTLSFSLDFQFAIFATDVVFPTPLTPTKTQTEGSPPKTVPVEFLKRILYCSLRRSRMLSWVYSLNLWTSFKHSIFLGSSDPTLLELVPLQFRSRGHFQPGEFRF